VSSVFTNSDLINNISEYFKHTFFDMPAFTLLNVAKFPLTELISKIVVAFVALATACNEFFMYMKNKKLSDILRHSNITNV
jgi:hypothetical protein